MDDAHEDGWGRLFVTTRCCGAATCRNIAPELLSAVPLPHDPPGVPVVLAGSYEEGAFTGVLRQPRSEADFRAARTAVAACPFNALRLSPPTRVHAQTPGPPWRDWPRRLEDDVWALGHPARDNFGALCYFIARPDGGILIDPPQPSADRGG